MSSTTPVSDQEAGRLGQAPGRDRQAVLGRGGLGDPLELAPFGQRERFRPTALVPGIERGEAVGVGGVEHVPGRSGLVKAASATFATGMPCADSSTVWARRQGTTDPVLLWMIRSSRLPSPSSISRTRTRSAIRSFRRHRAARPSGRAARHDRANVA